jgi:hypothetical protein
MSNDLISSRLKTRFIRIVSRKSFQILIRENFSKKNIFLAVLCFFGVIGAASSMKESSIDFLSDTSNIQTVSQQSLNIKILNPAFVRNENEGEEETLVEKEFEQELYGMVEGHPIEDMVPFIAQTDRKVAALIVGIAKKESNWGKRSPSKDGQDCYNYWGYKGSGSRGTSLGYGCFADPEEAVDIVGGRIHELAIDAKKETPQEMIIWKCGSSCAGHSPQSVNKWIQDVDVYYSRLVAKAY